MANQEQLTLLTQKGVAAWNSWRQNHPESEIDLSGADLRDFDLSSINLSEADLSGADFSGATTNTCLGYPQVTTHLLLDDPLLISAFASREET